MAGNADVAGEISLAHPGGFRVATQLCRVYKKRITTETDIKTLARPEDQA